MNRGKLILWSVAIALATLGLIPRPASADEDAPAESPRKMDLSVPGPGPRVPRTVFVHEGFYFRVNVGPGWQWTSFNDRGDLNLDLSGNSFALAVDLMIGGSPSPGLALGLGLLSNTGFDMHLEQSGNDVAETTAGHFIIGPFFDAYPDNRAGWHFGAEIGFAMSQFERQPLFVDAAFGGGAAAWVGHDFWIAPEWSAGLALRFSGAYLFGNQDQIDARSAALTTSLLVSLLYN